MSSYDGSRKMVTVKMPSAVEADIKTCKNNLPADETIKPLHCQECFVYPIAAH